MTDYFWVVTDVCVPGPSLCRSCRKSWQIRTDRFASTRGLKQGWRISLFWEDILQDFAIRMSLVVTFKSPFHLLRPHTVRFPSYNRNEIRGSRYLFIKKYSLASYYAPFKKEEGMLNFTLKYRHKLLSLTKRASTGDFFLALSTSRNHKGPTLPGQLTISAFYVASRNKVFHGSTTCFWIILTVEWSEATLTPDKVRFLWLCWHKDNALMTTVANFEKKKWDMTGKEIGMPGEGCKRRAKKLGINFR